MDRFVVSWKDEGGDGMDVAWTDGIELVGEFSRRVPSARKRLFCELVAAWGIVR